MEHPYRQGASSPLRARELVLASGNRGKLEEIRRLLARGGWRVRAQSEFDVPAVPETAPTFLENALIKARNAALHCGRPALADDSGLEVDALGGAPGVHSARFAGEGASDADNIEKLLAALQDVPETQRSARFRCLVVALRGPEDPTPLVCQGTWEGRIVESPRGQSGFGYDPIFLPEQSSLTVAELAPEKKNRESHRARALARLLDELEGWRRG